MTLMEDEFVKQEWREKADRRNPELRKFRESVEFDIRMTGCSLCGDADCWEAECMSNCEGCGLNNAQPNPDCQCKPGARNSTRIAHRKLIE